MDEETRQCFERIEANLQSASERIDILTKIHLDSHRDHEERIAAVQQAVVEFRAEVSQFRE